MWEYKREETSMGVYTPEFFFKLLNQYAEEGWELIFYNETKNNYGDYSFTVVMKKQL